MSLRKTKINRSNRISSPEEEEEEKERGKKNLRKNERERNKDPPHHVDACVCVLFLLLCPRLNVRLQFVWMRYVVVVLRQSFIQKVGRPFEKNENFKKKNIKQPTTVADRRTQIIIIISRCTWIYTTLNMNEEEIEQLARENFSRRIRAIAMESILLEKTKVEKKKTKKEGKEDDDWKSLRKNADDDDDDDDFQDDEKTKNAFMNARKEMARGLGISARAFQSAAEMLSQEDRAVNAAPSQKEEETKNVEENDAPEVDDDERRKRMAMMEEIAKRVCMENEKKVRARERLAVVDTILEVLKDAEGER